MKYIFSIALIFFLTTLTFSQNNGVHMVVISAYKPMLFFDSINNKVLIKQTTYSKKKYKEKTMRLSPKNIYHYAKKKEKKFKYKYFLYTELDLTNSKSFEYIQEIEFEEKNFELMNLYIASEEEEIMFSCLENKKEFVYFGFYIGDIRFNFSKLNGMNYEYEVSDNCSFYKEEFYKDDYLKYTYLKNDCIAVILNSNAIKFYIYK